MLPQADGDDMEGSSTTELHLHLRPHVLGACDQPKPPPPVFVIAIACYEWGRIQVVVQYYLEEKESLQR